jgi:hypothetical protein
MTCAERTAQWHKNPRLYERYNWFHSREHAGRVTGGHRGRKAPLRHASPLFRQQRHSPRLQEYFNCCRNAIWKVRRHFVHEMGKYETEIIMLHADTAKKNGVVVSLLYYFLLLRVYLPSFFFNFLIFFVFLLLSPSPFSSPSLFLYIHRTHFLLPLPPSFTFILQFILSFLHIFKLISLLKKNKCRLTNLPYCP